MSLLTQYIESLIDKKLNHILIVATVESVDKKKNVCIVNIDNEDDTTFDVRLTAAVDGNGNKWVIYPVVGSKVIAGALHNDPNQLCVLQFNDIDEIIFNGGERGNALSPDKVLAELGKTRELVDAIAGVLGGSPITEPGEGAPSALQAALKSAINGKSVGDYSAVQIGNIKL